MATRHPEVKAALSTSSVVMGVVQNIENENINHTLGSGVGEATQKVLEIIPATRGVAESVGLGASEYTTRVVLGDENNDE